MKSIVFGLVLIGFAVGFGSCANGAVEVGDGFNVSCYNCMTTDNWNGRIWQCPDICYGAACAYDVFELDDGSRVVNQTCLDNNSTLADCHYLAPPTNGSGLIYSCVCNSDRCNLEPKDPVTPLYNNSTSPGTPSSTTTKGVSTVTNSFFLTTGLVFAVVLVFLRQ